MISAKPQPQVRRRTGVRATAAGLIALAASALPVAAAQQDPQAVTEPQGAAETVSARRPPNVVLILTDDLGHNDISLNGNALVRTPHIDSIARDGVRFLSGYASHSTCAPSRAALLTGRYPQRFGFEYVRTPDGFIKAYDGTYPTDDVVEFREAQRPAEEDAGLPHDEVTLAGLLRSAGYRTGLFGKWHLGSGRSHWPQTHGFDEFVGFPGGATLFSASSDPSTIDARLPWSGIDNYLWANLPFRMIDNDRAVEPEGYVTDVLTERAVDFIERHHERPFFLFLAHPAPHNPLDAPRRIYERLGHIEDHKTRVYYAMVEAVDEGVGRVLDALARRGLTNDTIVIFSSDNGGAWYTRIPVHNLPYRGWKATFFEGGINVPLLLRWPGTIPAGQVVSGPASQIDVVPTVAAAAGAKTPADREIDGVNLLPMLVDGGRDAYSALRGRTLFWKQGSYAVLRQGQWKLQVQGKPRQVWLFDLERDPTEQVNLAARLPDRAAEMEVRLRVLIEEMQPPRWPSPYRARMRIGPHVDDGDQAQPVHVWNG